MTACHSDRFVGPFGVDASSGATCGEKLKGPLKTRTVHPTILSNRNRSSTSSYSKGAGEESDGRLRENALPCTIPSVQFAFVRIPNVNETGTTRGRSRGCLTDGNRSGLRDVKPDACVGWNRRASPTESDIARLRFELGTGPHSWLGWVSEPHGSM